MKRCSYCNTEKPDEAFAICRVFGGKVYRRLRCWQCKTASQGERIRSLRQWLRAYKKTLRCLRCGFADHRALAFHHKDAEDKEINVGETVGRGYSRARILREIEKCVVLCSNCHSMAHADRWQGLKRSPPTPVQEAMSNSETPSSTLRGRRKVCRYCLLEQDESCFEVCKVIGGRVYRRHKCRACKRDTQALRRLRLRTWLDGLKKTLRCTACGFSDFRALEFHHPDAQEKDFAIGEMVKDNRSIAAIEREMARCVALCANCHRITHYSDRAGKIVSRVQAASSPG